MKPNQLNKTKQKLKWNREKNSHLRLQLLRGCLGFFVGKTRERDSYGTAAVTSLATHTDECTEKEKGVQLEESNLLPPGPASNMLPLGHGSRRV